MRVCGSGGRDGQLLLMQAHAVPFELNWRVWVGLGRIVLSKLCCFKIAK